MKPPAATGFLLLFLFLFPGQASSQVTVTTLEKPGGFRADLTGYEKGVFQFRGGDANILPEDLVEIRFESRGAAPPASEGPVALKFINGDTLKGRILDGEEEVIKFSPSFMDGLEIAIETLAQIRFQENAGRFPATLQWDPIQKQDTLFRVTEKGWDHVKGIVTALNREKVSIDTDLGAFTFKTSQIIAIAIYEEPPYKAPGEPLSVVRLVDGSVLTGKLRGYSSDFLSLEWFTGKRLRIPAEKMEALWFKNTRYVFLSDLEPVRVEQIPYIGEKKDFLFPFQKDITCTGNTLSLGEKKYYKGLGVHSRCRLTYALQGKYRGFSSLIGIDDEVRAVPARGSVVFRILLDEKVRYESPLIRGPSKPLVVSLKDLQGARNLTLEVDFGDDSDAADRADWVHALLVK